jgi:hypothetical protein
MYSTKESNPIREPDQEMKGADQLQGKRLQNILAPNCQMALVKKDQWIFKISCVVEISKVANLIWLVQGGQLY